MSDPCDPRSMSPGGQAPARTREVLAVGLLGLLLAGVLFAPALRGDRLIVGHAHGEQLVSAWANTQAQDELVRHRRFPTRVANVAGRPESLVFPMSLPTALLSLPFYPVLDVASVFNAAMVLNFLLAFFGAYLFLRRVSGSGPAALPGALLYALSPYTLDHLAYGPIEATAMGWLPIALWAVQRWPGAELRRCLLKGALLALVFAASPYYGFFAFPMAALLMLARPGIPLKLRIGEVMATCAAGLLLMAPLCWTLLQTFHSPLSLTPDRVKPVDPEYHDIYLKILTPINLVSLVFPSRRFNPDLLSKGCYLGIPALLACAWCAFRLPRSRFYLWAGLLFLFFAVGGAWRFATWPPALRGEAYLVTPVYWLVRYVPPFTQIFTTTRALPETLLCMGAMMALLLGALPETRRLPISLGLGLLVGLDLLLLFPASAPLPTAPLRIPAYYVTLAASPDDPGVVDLPGPQTDMEKGQYFLYQQVHKKRIPYDLNFNSFDKESQSQAYRFIQDLSLSEALPNHARDLEIEHKRFNCEAPCAGVMEIREAGYQLLVLHRTGHAGLDAKLDRCVRRCTEGALHEDKEVAVFRIPPPERMEPILRRTRKVRPEGPDGKAP